MPISIYNYSKSKIPFLLELDSYLKNNFENNNYYYDSDWECGPNTMIVFDDNGIEEKLIEKVQYFSQTYFQEHQLSEEYIDEKKKKYKAVQKILSQLELRNKKGQIELKKQGEVILRAKKNGVYNSDYHENMFLKYRILLNPLHIEILSIYNDLDDILRDSLFLEMFKHIASLYAHGEKFGYLSFLSHSQGFFSRMKNEKDIHTTNVNFERLRVEKFENENSVLPFEIKKLLNKWKKIWSKIAEEMTENFNYANYDKNARISLEKQLQILDSNISKLNNSFHNSLREFQAQTQFLNRSEVLIYRDIVNLFYLTLPIFEQSMLKKQFFAYSTVRYFEKKYGRNEELTFD